MYDPEAIYQDADIEQAEFERQGYEFAAREHRSQKLREAGDLTAAADACPHGSGYPLHSLAAEHESDPGAGEDGYRCTGCGSRLDKAPWDGGTVLIPCELHEDEEVAA